MKILVTGSNGQLGSELQVLSKNSSHEFVFTDVKEFDITDEKAVQALLKKEQFEFVINCAAYTAVDKAQEEMELANLLNATAPRILAEACSKAKAILIHISTDYVFDGTNHMPYREDDVKKPQSVYGRSKLEGEVEVVLNSKQAIIIRTSWLYSSFGNNFVKTILKHGRDKEELNVVCDQIGTPTYAADLAKAIVDVIPNVGKLKGTEIFHFSNEGACSWYDFAKEIVALSGIDCKINPIESKAYPTPAPRPPFSVFNKTKIKNKYKLEIPYWNDSLKECLSIINK